MRDPKEIVERGYDTIAERYSSWRTEIEGSPAEAWLEELLPLLRDCARVLDLGCGNGEPAGRLLPPARHYTGVDISKEQLARAEARTPGGEFIHADFTKLEFEPGFFQAVVSVYAFNHLPRAELRPLLRRIEAWLEPGGYLLASFGCSGAEGVEDDWLGVSMFFASYTEPETLEFVREAGFSLERSEVVPIIEPEGNARFLWILARKPPSRGGGPRSSRE
ncbi:MAG: methyltransferase domain-containing protein [Gaiellales bacterium]